MTDRIIVRAGLARCGQIEAELEELQDTRARLSAIGPDFYEQYQTKIDALSETSRCIIERIDCLHYMQRQAIKLHFIHGYSWEAVAQTMYFSNSRVRTIATEGLDALIEPLKANDAAWRFCLDSVKQNVSHQ